jgi:hypothetical protein
MPLHVLGTLALASLGYAVYRVILVLTISTMRHLGWKRSSRNVLYKDTPLGYFGWIRGMPTTLVSTDTAPTTAVPQPPVADVTIGMLGIVPTLPLGTAQSVLISAGVCFSRVSSVMPANVCNILALALLLEKYIKQFLSDDDRHKIESNWLCTWKDKLAQPQRSPTQVLKAYCTALDITMDHLNLAMDWECWPVDTHGDFAEAQGIDGISE